MSDWKSDRENLAQRPFFKRCSVTIWLLAVALMMAAMLGLNGRLRAQNATSGISDISGRYDFLNPDNTLGILDEDGMLKGYIDVFQGSNESSAMLEYSILNGSRKSGKVYFRTQIIHEMYYRFTGTAERGSGKTKDDSDYLQLKGELETVTKNSVTGQNKVVRQQVVFKSKGKNQASF